MTLTLAESQEFFGPGFRGSAMAEIRRVPASWRSRPGECARLG